jgi:hypothetical protein
MSLVWCFPFYYGLVKASIGFGVETPVAMNVGLTVKSLALSKNGVCAKNLSLAGLA